MDFYCRAVVSLTDNTGTTYLTVQNKRGVYWLSNPKLGEMKKGATAQSVIITRDSTVQYQPVWQAVLKQPMHAENARNSPPP